MSISVPIYVFESNTPFKRHVQVSESHSMKDCGVIVGLNVTRIINEP